MQKGTILVIDPDENLRALVKEFLENDGYEVVSVSDSRSGLALLNDKEYDAVLLELILPDDDGLDVVSNISKDHDLGIIVMSAKSGSTERIIALEMGADDFLTKPFEIRELSAHVKAVLRRTEKAADSTAEQSQEQDDNDKVHFGNWVLDRSQYEVYDLEDNPLGLTAGEFELLDVLCSNANRVLEREQLFRMTRKDDYESYDRAIDIQIARIRKKLGDEDNTIIKTVRGVGYMLSDSKFEETG